jgi:Head domain of trimeric autotransporter adhesin
MANHRIFTRAITSIVILLAWLAPPASAQPVGTFRWQLQPFCNVVTVTVTQNGGVYRLEGTDDRCGEPQAASVIGTAFQNADGSIGMGLNIVMAPGGQPQPVSATLSLSSMSGTWRDEAGNTGAFVLTQGAGTGGNSRPLPAPPGIPTSIRLQTDGGFLAGGERGTGAIPAAGAGTRMMWFPGRAAFRAGRVTDTHWDEANTGESSVAIGFNTRATGFGSTALGNNATASGFGSVALGQATTASGIYSVAMGDVTTASGPQSTALGAGTLAAGSQSLATGSSTLASGQHSTALGHLTIASGLNSLAAGQRSQADGAESIALGQDALAGGPGTVVLGSKAATQLAAYGTFVFGDRSTLTPIIAVAPNQFLVRAAGGVAFYTNGALTTGLRLAPSGSQWLGLSDVNTKHLFRDLDGDEVLAKLARMPIREWSYTAQAPSIRHLGPTAQDFRAAFGLGEDPLRIGSMDADGVALAAVKALEARTRALGEENAALKATLDELRHELRELREQRRD